MKVGGSRSIVVYHVPLAFQCIYGSSDERGEDGEGKEVSEISEGRERVEITCSHVCK